MCAARLGKVRAFMLESRLERAFDGGVFVLYYQPRVAVASGRLVAVEASVHWRSPGLGLVHPAEFRSLAERSGLTDPLGKWMLRQACRQLRQWIDEGFASMRVAVRISAPQLEHRDMASLVRELLAQHSLPPSALMLEIAETDISERAEQTAQALHLLRATGVQLAIDDFGLGYSSLDYLERFPVDSVKVEPSFIAKMASDADLAAILAAIARRVRASGRKLVAKGVENEQQLRWLRRMRFHAHQGALAGEPLPADQLGPLLANAAKPRR